MVPVKVEFDFRLYKIEKLLSHWCLYQGWVSSFVRLGFFFFQNVHKNKFVIRRTNDVCGVSYIKSSISILILKT